MPLVGGTVVQLSRSASGFWTGMATREALVTGLSGSVVDTGLVIPDRAICLGVTTKDVTAITGAASFNCGSLAQPGKWGGTLGVAVGSTNRGVIGPEPVYADTVISAWRASEASASMEPSGKRTSRPASFAFWMAPRESPTRAA